MRKIYNERFIHRDKLFTNNQNNVEHVRSAAENPTDQHKFNNNRNKQQTTTDVVSGTHKESTEESKHLRTSMEILNSENIHGKQQS